MSPALRNEILSGVGIELSAMAFSHFTEVICSVFPNRHHKLNEYWAIIAGLAVSFRCTQFKSTSSQQNCLLGCIGIRTVIFFFYLLQPRSSVLLLLYCWREHEQPQNCCSHIHLCHSPPLQTSELLSPITPTKTEYLTSGLRNGCNPGIIAMQTSSHICKDLLSAIKTPSCSGLAHGLAKASLSIVTKKRQRSLPLSLHLPLPIPAHVDESVQSVPLQSSTRFQL